jgi:hypothetical protein
MCVAALAEGKGASHVPYRNSKLTRLLQESLSGNAMTHLLICASPTLDNYEESVSTCRFGSRAMSVQLAPRVNIEVDFRRLAEKLQFKLDEKRLEIEELQLRKDFSNGEMLHLREMLEQSFERLDRYGNLDHQEHIGSLRREIKILQQANTELHEDRMRLRRISESNHRFLKRIHLTEAVFSAVYSLVLTVPSMRSRSSGLAVQSFVDRIHQTTRMLFSLFVTSEVGKKKPGMETSRGPEDKDDRGKFVEDQLTSIMETTKEEILSILHRLCVIPDESVDLDEISDIEFRDESSATSPRSLHRDRSSREMRRWKRSATMTVRWDSLGADLSRPLLEFHKWLKKRDLDASSSSSSKHALDCDDEEDEEEPLVKRCMELSLLHRLALMLFMIIERNRLFQVISEKFEGEEYSIGMMVDAFRRIEERSRDLEIELIDCKVKLQEEQKRRCRCSIM